MYQLIDFDQWERSGNYRFFSTFANPTVSVTSEVECTHLLQRSKAEGRSFFLQTLWSCLRAINLIPEFRLRTLPDGRVACFDEIHVMTPVKVNDQGKVVEVRIRWNSDFALFCEQANRLIQAVDAESDTYSLINGSTTPEESLANVCISVTPDLYFTSVTHTLSAVGVFDFQLINVGKVVVREGREVMPVAITSHHGFTDGHHFTRFFRLFEESLQVACGQENNEA